MALPIAVQVFTVREDAARDFRGTLEKIKEMGYDGVELAGLYDMTAKEVKDIISDVGLNPISAHVALKYFREDARDITRQYKEIGVKYMVVPHIPKGERPGDDNFSNVIKEIEEYAKITKEYGIQLLYHNHDFEFVKVDGEYGLDILYKEVSAELLKTEIDTCWAKVAGVDPAEYIRKYKGRAPIVHLKDYKGDKAENMYGLIGEEAKIVAPPPRPSNFEQQPVGFGIQDIPAIIDAAKYAGAEWLVVELDKPPAGTSAMQAIEKSLEYLKSIQ